MICKFPTQPLLNLQNFPTKPLLNLQKFPTQLLLNLQRLLLFEEMIINCLKAAAAWNDKLLKKDITVQEVCNDPNVTQVLEELANTKPSLKCFQTAALWIKYIDMICLFRFYIKADRTGNWPLHIKTLNTMLTYFDATGHNMRRHISAYRQ